MVDFISYYFETQAVLRVVLGLSIVFFLVVLPFFLGRFLKLCSVLIGVCVGIGTAVGYERSLGDFVEYKRESLSLKTILREQQEVLQSIATEAHGVSEESVQLIRITERNAPEIFDLYVNAFYRHRRIEFSDYRSETYFAKHAVSKGVGEIKRAWRERLPEAQDIVFHAMAYRYAPIFSELASNDAKACSGFIAGQSLFYERQFADKQSAAIREAIVLFRTGDQVYTRMTKKNALEHARTIIGAEDVERLLSRSPPYDVLCQNLSRLYDGLSDDTVPENAAAMRHWIDPATFYRE